MKNERETMRKILLFALLVFLTMPILFLIRGEWEIALYWYSMLGMAWVGEFFSKWLAKNVVAKKDKEDKE